MKTHNARGTQACVGAAIALTLVSCADDLDAAPITGQEHAIIAGELAERVPWAVQVYDVRGSTGDFYQCTGTLVAPRWVLTAQHCTADEGETTAIRIGSNAYREGRIIAVDRVRAKHWELDLALLHLSESAGTEIVPLGGDEPLASPTPAIVYGWGSEGTPLVMAPFLKKAEVAITGRLTRADLGPYLLVSRGVTGAAFSGDSGGPLMVDGLQVGIMSQSRAEPVPTPQRENRHVDLPPQLAWLRPIIAEDEIAPFPSDRVVLYDLSSFDGVAQSFGVGRYRLADMAEAGNDRVSALRVPAGLQVTAYEHDDFLGTSHTYLADTDLIEAGFNDAISSIVVEPR